MSLSAWEQDALDSIKEGLADSDPALVARLAMFTRLAAGEAMPVREKIQAVSRQAVQRGARRSRRLYQRLGVGRTMLLVWLDTTLTLIAAALATRIDRAALELVLLMESGFARKIKDESWQSYQHEYGSAAGTETAIDLDTDLMRLATGGSAT